MNLERRLFIAMLAAGLSVAQTRAAATIDFVKDVQPILQKSCLSCHGADKHKGDLRLDSKAAAMKGGKDGVVIVASHADKSEFYRRIILPSTDDDVMPSKGDLLTKAQQDLMKEWINSGAEWPEGTIATLPAETETVAALPYSDLTPFKPSAAETAALAKLNAGPTQVRLVAAKVTWREANFHSQGTNVTDATIAPLKDVASLVDLNLSGTRITDAGLKTVGELTNLESLHLEHTKITDAGLANLKTLTHLAYLNLYGTAVTDQGMESLKGLTSLKHLYLWQTKVTAEGADGLKKALPKLRISRGWENDPIAIAAKAEAAAKMKADAEAKVKAEADAKAKADAAKEAKK